MSMTLSQRRRALRDISVFDPKFVQFAVLEDGKQIDMSQLGLYPALSGAERQGYHTEGDVIVSQTADGVDLNSLWSVYQQTLQIYNERRQQLINLLTFPVDQLIENVPQVGEAEFEQASEFGVPKSQRVELDYFQLAYDFHDYDTATRFTWKFLRDADQRQVDAVHQSILNADQRLLFRKVMEALYDNRNRVADIRKQNYTVFALYNADGTVPPPYGDNVFDGTHNHYMVSGGIRLDSDDFMAMYNNIAEHGYGIENGTTFVFLGNKAEVDEIKKWRRGENNGGPLDGSAPTATADYDFIPAANQPTMIIPNAEGLLGERPPNTWNGLQVTGSYAGVLVVENSLIPAGWPLMFGTGGAGDLQNPVGLREHSNVAYRGLRLLPGNQQRYPLIDSYYARGFGTGIRQRAAAVIMQIGTTGTGAGGTYGPPPQYTRGGGLSA